METAAAGGALGRGKPAPKPTSQVSSGTCSPPSRLSPLDPPRQRADDLAWLLKHVDLERERNRDLLPAWYPGRGEPDGEVVSARRGQVLDLGRVRLGLARGLGLAVAAVAARSQRVRGRCWRRSWSSALVAYIPVLLMAFMAMSLLLDRQPELRVSESKTGVTIVIAARNEEAGIAETIRAAVQTDYDGPVTIMLADNGSTDETCLIAKLEATSSGSSSWSLTSRSRGRRTR